MSKTIFIAMIMIGFSAVIVMGLTMAIPAVLADNGVNRHIDTIITGEGFHYMIAQSQSNNQESNSR